MTFLPMSKAISFRAATKSSYCFLWSSSTFLQWVRDRSCLGNCDARALVRHALQAAAPLVAIGTDGVRSANDVQYNSVWNYNKKNKVSIYIFNEFTLNKLKYYILG